MPNFDSTKKEILVTDNQGGLHRYHKGNPYPRGGSQADAVIAVMTGKIECTNGRVWDVMEPDALPGTIIVAEDIDSFRLCYEWVLDERL